MPSLIGTTSGGVSVAANYLKAVQSPGAALAGLTASDTVPLLTFSTPNLRLFKVAVAGVNLTTSPDAADSNWSRAIRALQVTSELFAVFAPAWDAGTSTSTFVYMAPDFNTNPGATTNGSVHANAVGTGNHTFSILEAALDAAITGGTATVTRAAMTGLTVA